MSFGGDKPYPNHCKPLPLAWFVTCVEIMKAIQTRSSEGDLFREGCSKGGDSCYHLHFIRVKDRQKSRKVFSWEEGRALSKP
jgi:hypothetical protein